MTTLSIVGRIGHLADLLEAAGNLPDRRWRPVLHAVPRHLFAPAVAWAEPGDLDAPQPRRIDREADPEGWLDTVYSNMAIITQRDDGAGDPAVRDGMATSSLSAPGIVMSLLSLLDVSDGHRVLDIGTGTGWTAGLLCARTGDHNVCSVEIDPAVLADAARNLRAAGYSPRLILADGAEGCPGEVFDRIHVTCGISAIPYAWVRQLRPGGVAVLPWMPGGWNGWKVKLTASSDGTASGTFHGMATYMMLRAQRFSPILWNAHHADLAATTATTLDPREIADAGQDATLALTAAVPRLIYRAVPSTDGSLSLHLSEAGDPEGSWAACDSGPRESHTVTQYGPRQLWDEAEVAFRRWRSHGMPGPDKYRLIVTPDGQHLDLA